VSVKFWAEWFQSLPAEVRAELVDAVLDASFVEARVEPIAGTPHVLVTLNGEPDVALAPMPRLWVRWP